MITRIGLAAGDIWHQMEGKNNLTLTQLVQDTGLPRELVLMALGWLAREGHVIVGDENTDFLSCLR